MYATFWFLGNVENSGGKEENYDVEQGKYTCDLRKSENSRESKDSSKFDSSVRSIKDDVKKKKNNISGKDIFGGRGWPRFT